MKLLLSLLCAAAAALLPSCTTSDGNFNSGPLVSVSVTYGTGKLVAKRPALADDLAAAATALEHLAAGVVNQETVTKLLGDHLPLGDPEARALAVLVASYFPSGDAAIPVSEKLSALCRTVAAAIRFGLPSSK